MVTKEKAMVWEMLLILFFILLGVVIYFFFKSPLSEITQMGESKYVLVVENYAYYLASFMLCFSPYFLLLGVRGLLQKEKSRSDLSNTLIILAFSVVCVYVSIKMTYLMYKNYAIFQDEKIILNDLNSPNRIYNYSDIKEVTEVQNIKSTIGKIIRRPYFVIIFSDGKRWSNESASFSKNLVTIFPYNGKLLQFILEKSGKKLKKINIEE